MISVFFSNIFILILVVFQLSSPYIFYFLPIADSLKLFLPEYLLLLLPSVLYIKFMKQNFKSALFFNKLPNMNILFWLILLAIIIQPSMGLLSAIASTVFPNKINSFVSKMSSMPISVSMFIVALTPAVCEEIAFRGVFANGYRNVDIKKAVFMNGLMFGIIHFSGQQFLYAFVMGIVLSYIVYVTGSIFSSMIVHFTFNGTQLLMSYFSKPTTSNMDIKIGIEDIVVYVIIAIATVPLAYFSIKQIEKNSGYEHNLCIKSDERVFDLTTIVIITVYIIFILQPYF